MISDKDFNQLQVKASSFGRSFHATRNISINETILIADSYSKVPDSFSRKIICSYCVQAPSLPIATAENRKPLILKCANCPARYCSKSCIDSNKHVHELECHYWSQIKQLEPYTQDYTMMLLRLLINVHLNERDLKPVWEMCDNFIKWDKEHLEKFIKPALILSKFVNSISFEFPNFDYELVKTRLKFLDIVFDTSVETCACLLLVCKEECNSFGIYTHNYLGTLAPRQSYGLSLFPTAVFFNHSCAPNVSHYSSEGNMVFRAIKGLETGEEAMINYIDEDLDVKERRRMLKEFFLFDCGCVKCIQDDN